MLDLILSTKGQVVNHSLQSGAEVKNESIALLPLVP